MISLLNGTSLMLLVLLTEMVSTSHSDGVPTGKDDDDDDPNTFLQFLRSSMSKAQRKDIQLSFAELNQTYFQMQSNCSVRVPATSGIKSLPLQLLGLEMRGGFDVRTSTSDTTNQQVLFVTVPIVSFSGRLEFDVGVAHDHYVLVTAFNLSLHIPVKSEYKGWSREAGKQLNVSVHRTLVGVNGTMELKEKTILKYLRDRPEVLFSPTSGCVSEKIAAQVLDLINRGPDEKLRKLQTANDGLNSTSRTKRQVECSNGVDTFLDEVLNGAQGELNSSDPLVLGEINDFVYLHDGILHGLSTVHRARPSSSSCVDTKVNIEAPLAANGLRLYYHWRKKILFMDFDGTIRATASRLEINFKLTLETVAGFQFELNGSDVTDLRDFDIKVTGFGPLNPLFRGIVKLVNAVSKSTVKKRLSGIIYGALRNEVDKLSFSYE